MPIPRNCKIRGKGHHVLFKIEGLCTPTKRTLLPVHKLAISLSIMSIRDKHVIEHSEYRCFGASAGDARAALGLILQFRAMGNKSPLDNWAPDFRVTFACGHSECGSHSLLIAVLPIDNIEGFGSHPCLSHIYGPGSYADKMQVHIDAGAAFGSGPAVTRWEMSHGSGRGTETVHNWVSENADVLWIKAKNLVTKI
jgi:hypothetical protein